MDQPGSRGNPLTCGRCFRLLDVPCRFCGSKSGQQCRRVNGSEFVGVHTSRLMKGR